MSTYPGTSCLLTDDDIFVPTPRSRVTHAERRGPTDPGDDRMRAARAASVGRPLTQCADCDVPTSDAFTRRSASGKTFCILCADRLVAAYYARYPAARPTPERRWSRDLTGTSYLNERERYAVRFHAGHAQWQISDTQTTSWTSARHATEAHAEAAAARMNVLWREQVAHEQERGDRP